MSEMINSIQEITYDAIKIGLASPDKIREWSKEKKKTGDNQLQNLKA
jgi:DNA-directed RNA polymerase subunit beta'